MSRTQRWERKPAPKRRANFDGNPRPIKRAYAIALQPPTRTYPGSMVPAASRGYSPNVQELKVFDVAPATYNVNTTGIVQAICMPTLGSDMNNRIGRKIELRTFQCKGWICIANAQAQPPTVSEVAAQCCRFMLVWDTQPNGAIAAITDILQTATPASMLNLNNRDRFRILKDKMFALDPFLFDTATSKASATNQIKCIKWFKKLSLETVFNATNGGTIADIASGALLAVWVGSQANGLNGPVDAAISYRVRYADK